MSLFCTWWCLSRKGTSCWYSCIFWKRRNKKHVSPASLSRTPLPLLPPLSVDEGKWEKTCSQQCALPPARCRARQRPMNLHAPHVMSYCAPLCCGLPASAGFLAEVIVRPPPPTIYLSVGRKCSYTLSHELKHIFSSCTNTHTHRAQGPLPSFPRVPKAFANVLHW